MSIKWNWGTGIVLAFSLFMSFILYFVLKVQTDHQYDNDLVAADYYKREATVQTELNQETKAAHMTTQIQIQQQTNGILIDFPASWNPAKIHGLVSLYRPSDEKLDFTVPIACTDTQLLIPKSRLLGGRWDITITWTYNGIAYLKKDAIYIE